MAESPKELDILRDLRARSYAEGGVFWNGDDELAVFDPEAAQQINALNFRDLTLPHAPAGRLRGRAGKSLSWKQVRAAWLAQLHRMSDAKEVARLAASMSNLLEGRCDRSDDLVWVMQEIFTRTLLPVVIAGLSSKDHKCLLQDQDLRVAGLLAAGSSLPSFRSRLNTVLLQARVGLAIRRELRGRATERRPRQLDLTDPIVDLLPELGIDRALSAVLGVLAAIGGPPGAAGACLLYELSRQAQWADQIAGELTPIAAGDLFAAPTRVAPMTYRFVKETLRMWSPPSLMVREVRTDISNEQASLKLGQTYLLSPFIIHHDPRHWKDPDTFDPDRWLPDSERGPSSSACYVPFGWAPRSCIGAGLGTTQLILLCHLFSTRYRVQVSEPEAVTMSIGAAPVPRNFRGTINRC
jgi:cytochrome P450